MDSVDSQLRQALSNHVPGEKQTLRFQITFELSPEISEEIVDEIQRLQHSGQLSD